MCLFAVMAGLFPRLAFVFYWIARPAVVSAAFGGMLLWPLLGLVLAPFTTLMYTVLWGPGGLSGLDWLWVGLAFILDLGHYTYSAYGNRDRIPGYGSSGGTVV